MKYRTASRLGAPVSEIGLGCWQIGSAGWGTIPDDVALEILKASVEKGVTFLDTADVYGAGKSESLIGRFLQTLPQKQRDGIFIASKLGRLKGYPNGYSYELLRECTADTVKRLGRTSLDLQQLHCVPHAVLKEGKVFGWLRQLKAEGLIRHWGASVESDDEALTCLQQDDLDSLQIIFNIFRQKPRDEIFAAAKKRGVALIIRLPLASGLLAGKYTNATSFPSDDHRNFNRDGKAFNDAETFAGISFEKAVELTDRVRPLLGEGASMADLAMRWILDHDAVTTVIPGASKVSQASGNVAASDLAPLGSQRHERIKAFYQSEVRQHIRGPY